ncbi:hypothetical protein BJX62DRAFT_212569 [Aspergillus germanicus]
MDYLFNLLDMVGEPYAGETHRSMEPTWCDAGPGNTSVLSNTMLLDLTNVICLARILVVCSLLVTLPYTSYSIFVAQGAGRLQGLGLAVYTSQTGHHLEWE